jgi:hypothetical protein
VAPANVHELCVLPEIAEFTSGMIIGDRNYHSPKTREKLASMGVELLAPYSSKKRDPAPKKSAFLSRLRYRIERVMNLGENPIEMRIPRSAYCPCGPRFPHY